MDSLLLGYQELPVANPRFHVLGRPFCVIFNFLKKNKSKENIPVGYKALVTASVTTTVRYYMLLPKGSPYSEVPRPGRVGPGVAVQFDPMYHG